MTRILILCLLLAACTPNPNSLKPLPPYNATNASNAGNP